MHAREPRGADPHASAALLEAPVAIEVMRLRLRTTRRAGLGRARGSFHPALRAWFIGERCELGTISEGGVQWRQAARPRVV